MEELEKGKVSRDKAKPQKKGKETKEPREKRTRSVDNRDKVAIRRE